MLMVRARWGRTASFDVAGRRRPSGDGMWNSEWFDGPYGLNAVKGRTFPTLRTVLVAVHTVTAGTRLSDIWPLLGSDHRVQLVFSRPTGALMAAGTDRFLERLGGVVAPWQHAVQVPFDLAIAASNGQLERLHAPVLTFPHGIGAGKLNVRYDGLGSQAPLEVAGMERAAHLPRPRYPFRAGGSHGPPPGDPGEHRARGDPGGRGGR